MARMSASPDLVRPCCRWSPHTPCSAPLHHESPGIVATYSPHLCCWWPLREIVLLLNSFHSWFLLWRVVERLATRWCLRTSIAAECVPNRFVVRCSPTKKVLLLYVPPFALLCTNVYPMSSRKIVFPYVVTHFCPPKKSFAAMCCPRCLSVPPCITLSDAFGCEPKSTNEAPCS